MDWRRSIGGSADGAYPSVRWKSGSEEVSGAREGGEGRMASELVWHGIRMGLVVEKDREQEAITGREEL